MQIAVSLVLTWVPGLIFPLLIRYLLVRRPVSRKTATWIAAINSITFWIGFRILNSAIENPDATKGLVWIVVFLVARWVMSKGYNPSSEIAVERVEGNRTGFDAQPETNTKAELIKARFLSDQASDPEISQFPVTSKSKKFQVLLILTIIFSVIISAAPAVYDWSNNFQKNSQIEYTGKFPDLSDRDRTNKALESFLGCMSENKHPAEHCFARHFPIYFGDSSHLTIREIYLLHSLGKDEKFVEEVESRYISLSTECFNEKGQRIEFSKLTKNLKHDCYNWTPGYFKLIENEYKFSEFWDREGNEMVVAVLITFFTLLYLFFSIGYIPNFPHKGWKRLSLVIAGSCSGGVVIYGLLNYDGIFGVEGWPVILIGLGLYPAFFWFVCGTKSLVGWVKEGFAN